MNIFAIEGNEKTGEIDWIKSAKSQDNMRVVKMILESCQILSTALNEQGIKAPYRSFNPKHPSCLWAAESSENFRNLMKHCASMIQEYEMRFGKIHKCKEVLVKIRSKPKMRYPKNKVPVWFEKYRNGKPYTILEAK